MMRHARRIVLAGILVLALALPASAQVVSYPSRTTLPFVNFLGGTSLTGGTSTLTLAGGQLIVPAGTALLPSAAVGEADTGLYRSAAAQLDITLGGTRYFTFSSASLDILLGNLNLGASGDVRIYREATDILQLGQDLAIPIAQMFKGPDGAGTDKAGGDMTYAPGRPTGTGPPGVIYHATSTTGGVSNSTQQAFVNRTSITENGLAVLKAMSVGSLTYLTLNAGEIGVNKMVAAASAPGAAGGKIALLCGTNAGTAKIVAYAGTSSTAVTIVDNIGTGVTGC